jgi:pimeloyl-ACP methyl ester carboxylesterase
MTKKYFTRKYLLQISLVCLVAIYPSVRAAQSSKGPAKAAGKPAIVLVHGAFADGTGWHRVIAILQRDGFKNVIAVQNPLSSFATDVETTKRVIAAQQGPVVVVGHSYGGAVISEAAAGYANVKALVYIAAFAPEVGEPIGAFGEKYPNSLGAALRPDAAGFLYMDRGQFHDIFAGDLPVTESDVAAATQKPIIGSVFGVAPTQAAWKTIPSWYLVATEDKAINPDLERFYAKRMGAKTVEVKSSHVAFLSQPAKVAQLIEEAARASMSIKKARIQ